MSLFYLSLSFLPSSVQFSLRSRARLHVFAYALARTSGERLLFKGDDFAKTDISRVV
ncbi:MAG: type II toxin-antitoxin system VapC family toxin [Vicinamibacterales bacterium]